jgi:hypothetical protein
MPCASLTKPIESRRAALSLGRCTRLPWRSADPKTRSDFQDYRGLPIFKDWIAATDSPLVALLKRAA